MRFNNVFAVVFVAFLTVSVMGIRKKSMASVKTTTEELKGTRAMPFEKTSKVLIIGAGPSGVHMASKLVRNGYTDITLLEKTDRVGGKSYTVFEDGGKFSPDFSPMGVRHEMGTCYLHVAYHGIRQLIDEYEVMEKPYEIDPPGRAIWYHDAKGMETIEEMEDYVKDVIRNNSTNIVGKTLPPVELVTEIHNYIKAHKAVFPTFGKGSYMPPRPASWQLAAINMTFADFLRKHNCFALEGFLRLAMTAQGYGIPELMPALYGLWWITPELLINTIKTKIGIGTVQLTMLKDGYAKLWQTIARKDNLNVIYHADVQKVSRENGKVQATYAVNGGDASEKEFDFLILAMPFKKALDFLDDADDTEKEIFSSLNAATLVTTLVKVAPVKGYTTINDRKSIAYFYDGLTPEGQSCLNCMRYSKAALTPDAAYAEDAADEQVQVTYQFYPPGQSPRVDGQDLPPFKTNENVLKQLIDSSAAKGIDITSDSVVEQFPWPYMYQFDQEGINKEYPWEIYDMNVNAARKTWYIGSSACFESVHDVTDYNSHLLSEFGIKDTIPRGLQSFR